LRARLGAQSARDHQRHPHFSKNEAEKLELEAAPFSVRTVLDEVTERSAPGRREHVELIAAVAPDVPDALVGDPLRVRRC